MNANPATWLRQNTETYTRRQECVTQKNVTPSKTFFRHDFYQTIEHNFLQFSFAKATLRINEDLDKILSHWAKKNDPEPIPKKQVSEPHLYLCKPLDLYLSNFIILRMDARMQNLQLLNARNVELHSCEPAESASTTRCTMVNTRLYTSVYTAPSNHSQRKILWNIRQKNMPIFLLR